MALAIFDLDETLIAGDSASLWLRFLVDQGHAPRDMLVREAAMMKAYRVGALRMEDYMEFTLKPLQGLSVHQVAGWVERFVVTRILPILYPQAREALARYRRDGHTLLIVSATGAHLVGPIAHALGVDDFLAIDLETRDNVYTGATRGILTYQQGKVARLEHWCATNGKTLEHSHGYSDSINDAPLLSAVAHPHVVNPDEQLAALARQCRWPCCEWGSSVALA